MSAFRTSKILIFSNPLLLFLFFMNRKSIHFIQSIDENLFSSLDYNPYAVAVYKYLIKFLMKYGRNYQIYNTKYVANYYKKPDRALGIFSTVDNLYYDISLQISENKSQDKKKQCVWIGTMHKRKGFEELITIANQNLDYVFKCIVSGKSIYNQELPENVSLLSNISHNDVLNIISESRLSVVTSDFESLSLPIYEGLLFKNIVLAKSSEYIYSNVVAEFIHVYSNPTDINLNFLHEKKEFIFKNPQEKNEIIGKGVLKILSL